MSSREPDPRRNALSALLPEPPRNALPMVMAQDATRVAPRAPAAPPERRMDTISAAPERGWFGDLTAGASKWMRDNKVASMADYPPIKLLGALFGEDPLSSVGGPGSAISAFATRSPAVMRRFADPNFHRWMIKHGPEKGYFSQVRDWAPETVIDDLYQRYLSSDLGKRSMTRAAERAAQRSAREQAALGRRRMDAVQ